MIWQDLGPFSGSVTVVRTQLGGQVGVAVLHDPAHSDGELHEGEWNDVGTPQRLAELDERVGASRR